MVGFYLFVVLRMEQTECNASGKVVSNTAFSNSFEWLE